MSPLAKVFVVVNLILSVAFFGSSATLFATRVNWKQKAMEFKAGADSRLKEIEKLYTEQGRRLADLDKIRATLDTNLNTMTADKNKLQTQLADVQGQLDRANGRIETEVKEKTQLLATQQDLLAKNTELTRLLETARKDADAAKAAAEVAQTEMTRIRVDLDKLNEQHSQQLIAFNDLQGKADSQEIQLQAARKAGLDPALFNTPPPIDAIVQAVGDGANAKLVVLSVGRDQKVQEGFKFTVYRGDKFIGKVQVVKVYEDLAGARVLFTQEGESVQIGDKAATQL